MLRFTRCHLKEWILTGVLLVQYGTIGRFIKPYRPQFARNDPTIQFPWVEYETFSVFWLTVLCVILPVVGIAGIAASKFKPGDVNFIRHLETVFLGFFLSMFLNAVFVDFLKNNIGGLRPDFMARCGPDWNKLGNSILVSASWCTAPYGKAVLEEGFRSTPSGHTSVAFGGLGFLSLYIMGQYQAFVISIKKKSLLLQFGSFLPLILATYIGLTRVQDYRHDFFDVFLGGFIGLVLAWWVYHHFFNWIWHSSSDKVYEPETDALPI